MRSFRFPAYIFLSALSFVNLMNYIHEKHLLYLWLPLMYLCPLHLGYTVYTQSLRSLNSWLSLSASTHSLTSTWCVASTPSSQSTRCSSALSSSSSIKSLTVSITSSFTTSKKSSMILCCKSLFNLRIFVDIEYQPRFAFEAIIGVHLYYRIIRELIKPPTLKSLPTTRVD